MTANKPKVEIEDQYYNDSEEQNVEKEKKEEADVT